jgi:phenylpyruvate tautomerase PptA (4-oxalocrotonate tautomerase family)
MPFVRIDAVEGRSAAEVQSILEAVHQSILGSFDVPARDRYQIYHAHPSSSIVMLDTGLGFERSEQRLMLTVISRPRTPEQKQHFYRDVCERLSEQCGIGSNDVMISMTENANIDWSFGFGVAQFTSGAL